MFVLYIDELLMGLINAALSLPCASLLLPAVWTAPYMHAHRLYGKDFASVINIARANPHYVVVLLAKLLEYPVTK